jgi:hypothetical protein
MFKIYGHACLYVGGAIVRALRDMSCHYVAMQTYQAGNSVNCQTYCR